VFNYLIPLVAAMEILTSYAFAVLVANDTGLEALTVLLQTLALFAIASLGVSLAALAKQISSLGEVLLWLLGGRKPMFVRLAIHRVC
jgi:hypothetical protein